MKKFTVGLPVEHNEAFLAQIIAERDRISQVYFSPVGFAGGRGLPRGEDHSPWSAPARQLETLDRLHAAGIGLNVLFNANCYGGDSLSHAFFDRLGDTVDLLVNRYHLCSVTTTSPLIARFVHANFEGVRTCASVNMSVGSPEGMEYIAKDFDGFYLAREYNRDLSRIRRMREACDGMGKELYLLANSGCLNHCSAHTFHDNLVSHEGEIVARDNLYRFEGVCQSYLRANGERFLQRTNFIRPEDLELVADYFDGIKLATRTSPNPGAILNAYLRDRHAGAITSLLEPDHTGLFFPQLIENQRIPSDFTARVLQCNKQCDTCTYCADACRAAMIQPEVDL